MAVSFSIGSSWGTYAVVGDLMDHVTTQLPLALGSAVLAAVVATAVAMTIV